MAGTGTSNLAAGQRRVFAHAGIGKLHAGRWGDIDADDPRLPGWLAAGFVSETGPRGEAPPEHLRRPCCGGT